VSAAEPFEQRHPFPCRYPTLDCRCSIWRGPKHHGNGGDVWLTEADLLSGYGDANVDREGTSVPLKLVSKRCIPGDELG